MSGRLLALTLLGALGSVGCFPDYTVADDRPIPGMNEVGSAGESLAYTSNGNSFVVSFSRSFRLDRYEVTVERFQAWLDAGRPAPCVSGTCPLDEGGSYASSMTWDASWNTYIADDHYRIKNGTFSDCDSPSPYGTKTTWELGATQPDLPMTCVSWFEAVAFCYWIDGRLPTNAEWVYAATNHGQNVPFPWGQDNPDCNRANVKDCGFPKNVGAAPNGRTLDDVEDMVGNVFEWVWDSPWATPPQGQQDFAGPTDTQRSRHGGAYFDAPTESRLRNDTVEQYGADEYYSDAGFRCAQTVK